MKTVKHTSLIDPEVLYYQAIQMAYETFLKEEKKGYMFTEQRFINAAEATRTLYKPFKQD